MTEPLSTHATPVHATVANLYGAEAETLLAFFQRDAAKQVPAKIMLVDDDAVTIAVVRRHLESVGYHDFVVCTSAILALEQLRQERPDMVLLDVVMPDVNGLQILRQLREDEDLSRTPVIILTASTNPETKLRALESGATDFLAKPVDPSELVLRVRNVLNVKAFQDHLASYAEGLERAVSQRTAQLVLTQRQVSQGYRAGKAEIAVEVLHNVGNAMNSVNVSVSMIHKGLAESRLPYLPKAAALLAENAEDADFFTQDERGTMLPDYLTDLARVLMEEREATLREVEALTRHLGHIKAIVATQQKNVDLAGQLESVSLAALVDDAVCLAGLPNDQSVKVTREFDALPEYLLDKQKLIQVFLNLIRNAQQALEEVPPGQRQLTLRIREHTFDRVRIEINDTGAGIREEDLPQIFQSGFTTKPNGTGVGLRSCAHMVQELGGSLSCLSPGPGKGASFVVELPFTATELHS
jgi:DNA-binding response OmpR family regulator